MNMLFFLIILSGSLLLAGCAGLDTTLRPGDVLTTLETRDTVARPGRRPSRDHTITYADLQTCAQTSLLGRGTVNNAGEHLGGLSVHPGESGEPARVDIVCFDAAGRGRSYAISVDELRKIPALPGLSYGVSVDSKLLLIQEEGPDLWVLRDREGNYDSQDFQDFNRETYRGVDELMRRGYGWFRGRRTEDGRIAIMPPRRSQRSTDFRVYVDDFLSAFPGFRRSGAR